MVKEGVVGVMGIVLIVALNTVDCMTGLLL